MARGISLIVALAAVGSAAAPAAAEASAGLRVVGGAPVGAPAYMGLLQGETGSGTVQACGGVAVAPYVFLTAAHCVVDQRTGGRLAPRALHIVFGESDPWTAARDGRARPTGVVRFAMAPYGRRPGGIARNDVAVLQLSAPAPGTVRRAPRSRPSLAATGRTATIMGWGRVDGRIDGSSSPLLQQARMAVQRRAVCADRYAGFDQRRMLCIYGGRSSACMGDSGGPLLVEDRGRRYVIGVVGGGDAHCALDVPSVYARVSSGPMADFVARQTARLQRLGTAHHPPAMGRELAVRPPTTTATTLARRLTLEQAGRAAARYGRSAYGWTRVTTGCVRRNPLQAVCRIYGRKDGRWWRVRREVLLSNAGVIVRA